jgi:hypothetical protein
MPEVDINKEKNCHRIRYMELISRHTYIMLACLLYTPTKLILHWHEKDNTPAYLDKR